MKLADGVATLKEVIATRVSTQTARIGRMEMIDQITGDVYCTWIQDGEWQKVRGECKTIEIAITSVSEESQQPSASTAAPEGSEPRLPRSTRVEAGSESSEREEAPLLGDIIQESSAGLSNSFQNISDPLKDLWQKIVNLFYR